MAGCFCSSSSLRRLIVARIVHHESLMLDGKRVPSEGAKGRVFVIREGLSGDEHFILAAGWVCWRHLSLGSRDAKLTTGKFEVGDGIEIVTLERSPAGWPSPYELANLKEDFGFRPIVIRLAK